MRVSCFFPQYYTIEANIWHLSTLPVVRSNQWHLASDSSNYHTHAWPLQNHVHTHVFFSNLNKIKPMVKQITDACLYMYTVSGPMCFSYFFENIIPSGRIFDTCRRFQLSDQISDISHRILPIVTRMHDLFKIVPSDLFSYINKVKHVCKQIQRHVYIMDTTSLIRQIQWCHDSDCIETSWKNPLKILSDGWAL